MPMLCLIFRSPSKSSTTSSGRNKACAASRYRRRRRTSISKSRLSSAASSRLECRMTMNQPEPITSRANVVGFGLQERRLGSTILRTYRQKVDIGDVVPNERQARLCPKEGEELQRQIEPNEGLFEPLLVEPHPDLPDKFRIIDGERR